METELSRRTSKQIIWLRWAGTIVGATLALWLSPSVASAGQKAPWTGGAQPLIQLRPTKPPWASVQVRLEM